VYFDDHSLQEGLGRRALRGGAISIIGRAIIALVQVGSVVCLARLLTPEDYGLVAMVTALTGFAPVLVDLGTRDAVVQQLRITEGDVSTLFWLTVGVGFSFALAISASGPVIAAFYKEPQLTGLVAVSSLTFAASALTAQHQALLRRAVMFRELAIIDVTAAILSAGGAIAMAYFGLGYWALVTRPVSMSSLMAAGVWWYCRWRPGRPVLTPAVKAMVKFGLNLTGFSMTDFVGGNGDRVLVGQRLGARTLGYYQNALFIYSNLLDVLIFPLHQVAVASLSKLQGDLGGFRRSWAKALSTVAFYAMPAFGILAVTGADVVVMLLGEKWAETGVLLSVLALRGIPHSVERTLGWLHVAAGRSDRWLHWGVVATCIQLLALFCGLPFGPLGIVCAYVIVMYILFVPALAYAGAPSGIGARDVIRVVGAPLTGALATAAVGFGLRASLVAGVQPVERLVILILTYVAMYIVVVVGLLKVREPMRVILSLIKAPSQNR